MNFLEKVSKSSESAVAALRVRSALNPMLWLSGIAAPLFVGAAWLFRTSLMLSAIFTIVAVLPVLVAAGVFIYFALYHPEKLQSEDYQLRQETIRMIGAKASTINLDPTSLDIIATQTRRAVESGLDRLT